MDYFEQEEAHHQGMRRNLRLRNLRRWIVMAALAAFAVETQGLPHLRLSDPARVRGGSLDYWSVTGLRSARPANTPLIVLFPLDRPVLEHARDAVLALWQEVEDGLG